MIAIDTNILVYAHRRDSQWHSAAAQTLVDVAEGVAPWGIAAHCLVEFFAIVTNPRIYRPPSTSAQAVAQIDAWLESPTVQVLSESDGFWPSLRQLLLAGRVQGGHAHDARIAALCLAHGVDVLLSADRDFGRFPQLTVKNPLVVSQR